MDTRENVTRISVSLPPKLLKEFDEAAGKAGFTDRSKALQTSMRSFIAEQKQTLDEGGLITGALLIVYNHEVRGIDGRLTDIEHDRMKLIASSTHVHLGISHCLKVVVAKGRVSEIRAFERALRSLKGVMQLKLSFIKTESD